MAERIIEMPDGHGMGTTHIRERIVRCRDCEHYAEHEWVIATDVSDVCHFFGDGVKVEPDGFCKWGVRRTDG